MAKQTFTVGQVLTATQMNDLQTNDFNQTVSTKTNDYTFVVGDRGTRVVANKASAIAFTVDNSIFSAGDTLGVHNINTGVLTLTAGAGVTINGADVLTVAQWQGGTIYFTSASSAIFFPTAKTVSAGGLTFISSTTIGSAVSSVTVSSAFSSTYDNYLITCYGGSSGSADYVGFRFGTTSSSTYAFARMSAAFGDAALTFTSSGSATSIERVGYQSTNGAHAALVVYGPNLASRSGATFASTALTTNGQFFQGSGMLNDATQYTSFTLVFGTAQTGGTIRVYGYANS